MNYKPKGKGKGKCGCDKKKKAGQGRKRRAGKGINLAGMGVGDVIKDIARNANAGQFASDLVKSAINKMLK